MGGFGLTVAALYRPTGLLQIPNVLKIPLIFPQEDSFGTPAFMREWEMKERDEDEEKDGVEEEERRGERRERRRRHSPTSMNAWYSELGGRNKEVDGGVGGVAAKVRKGEGQESCG